jgi:hypothetical protein
MKGEKLFYLDELLGRMVVAGNNRPVGRLEEFHCEQRGDSFHIIQFVIGSAGLAERLNVGVKALFGKSGGGKVASWKQLDISDPQHPRLTCSTDDLVDVEAPERRMDQPK